MSVVIETTLGDITIDLFVKERPRACLNFLKLCKIKYYNYNLFHTINRNFIAQTGDPTGSRNGGESIFGVLEGPLKRYFEAEKQPRIKHTNMGLVSFVGNEDCMLGSQFFITLGTDLTYLDAQHCVFGEVVEGLDVLELLNEAICDNDNRPYKDIRITHTIILDDPLPDPEKLCIPDRSPSPSGERLQGGRIAPDEEIDETIGRTMEEVIELQADREAKARATILEMVGDIPDAEMAPPENVLFVCKLNPVTTDDDLEIIFSRFGKIKSCEVIRDKKSGDSLQYAFVEFEEQKACEDAYFKMDNVLIDDRRIHVDFSQSVAKVKWHGKGRGVTTYDDKGRKTNDSRGIGNGDYKSKDRYRNDTNRNRDYDNRKRNDYDYSRRYDERNDRNYYKDNRRYNNWGYSNRRWYGGNADRYDGRNYRYDIRRRYDGRQTDKYNERQAGKYEVRTSDRYEARQNDKYNERQAGKYESRQADKYESRQTDKYESRQADKYESRQADKYESRQVDKYESREADNKSEGRQTDKYEARQTSRYGERSRRRHSSESDGDDDGYNRKDNKRRRRSISTGVEYKSKKKDKRSKSNERRKGRMKKFSDTESSSSTSSSSSSSSSSTSSSSEEEERKKSSKKKKKKHSK